MNKKDMLLFAGAISLVVCAGLLTWRNVAVFVRSRRPPAPVAVVANWQQYVRGAGQIGAKFPRVTILEFVDYACAASRNFAPDLDKVLINHPAEVALVIRHLPIHGEMSDLAARAAVCASRHGKFEPYHRLLMRQPNLVVDSLVPYASRVGVWDTAAFNTCIGSEAASLVVAADTADANKLGVRGTPTIFVNGEQYAGGQPMISTIVELHLNGERGR